MTLREIGEHELLAQILPRLTKSKRVVVAAGDDCAVLSFRGIQNLLVLKVDCVVEGVHFTESASPAAVGWKAMMRPLSDFAAMAAVPEFALITLAIAANKKQVWVRELYRGLKRAARRFDVAIVGGETSATVGGTMVAVSIAGYVQSKTWIGRNGGKVNDDLFVTGELGGSIRSRHLKFVPRLSEARWLASHFKIHAMIDLSDGVGIDLPRLARASSVGFQIEQDALPIARGCTIRQAISEGEDYELLFALSRRNRSILESMWRKKFPRTRLTRIGKLIHPYARSSPAAPGFPAPCRGYVHFEQPR
jgi:thiamine-monophosphate kinase